MTEELNIVFLGSKSFGKTLRYYNLKEMLLNIKNPIIIYDDVSFLEKKK